MECLYVVLFMLLWLLSKVDGENGGEKKKIPHDEISRYNVGLEDFKSEKKQSIQIREGKQLIFKDSSTVDTTRNRKSLLL